MQQEKIVPVAFLSYAHLDDNGTSPEISRFHDRLQSELSIHTGFCAKIFLDKKSLAWGARWNEFIKDTLNSASFLVPILTPAFFRSDACRDEYAQFQEAEARMGRDDLILPVYYVKCREIEGRVENDNIVKDILTRQYRDFRNMRHKDWASPEVLLEFSSLAEAMTEVFFKLVNSAALSETDRIADIKRDRERVDYLGELLDRPLNYENLIAYSVEAFPSLPASPLWTKVMLNDLDKRRYTRIRDIDREYKYAKASVDAYSRQRPDLFLHSTDFLTKSLVFVDSDFRSVHGICEDTRTAALKAGITRY